MPLEYKTIAVNIAGGQNNSESDQTLKLPSTVTAKNCSADEKGALLKRPPFEHAGSTTSIFGVAATLETSGQVVNVHDNSPLGTLGGTYLNTALSNTTEQVISSFPAGGKYYDNYMASAFRVVNGREIAVVAYFDNSSATYFASVWRDGVVTRSNVRLVGWAGTPSYYTNAVACGVIDEDTVEVYFVTNNAFDLTGDFNVARLAVTDSATTVTSTEESGGFYGPVYNVGACSGPPGEVIVCIRASENPPTGTLISRKLNSTTVHVVRDTNSYVELDGPNMAYYPTALGANGSVVAGGRVLTIPSRFVYTKFSNISGTTTVGSVVESITPPTATTYSGVGWGIWGVDYPYFITEYSDGSSQTGILTYNAVSTATQWDPLGNENEELRLVHGPALDDNLQVAYGMLTARSASYSPGTIVTTTSEYARVSAQAGHLSATRNKSGYYNTATPGEKAYFYVASTFATADVTDVTGSAVESPIADYSSATIRLVKVRNPSLDPPAPRLELPNGSVLYGGSAPALFEGSAMFPLAAKFDPYVVAASSAAGAGDWVAAAAISVRVDVQWEFLLPSGSIYRITSTPMSVDIAVGETVAVSYQLPATLSDHDVVAIRSQVRIQDEGEFYYSDAADHGPGVRFLDTRVKTAAVPALAWYAIGELDQAHYPPVRCMAEFNNQLWVVDAGEPTTVYRTKPMSTGYVPELSPELVEYVPFTINAMETMDSKLFVFGNNKSGFFAGNGEDYLGNGTGYKFSLLPSGPTPDHHGSIVVTPIGMVFASGSEFHALLRNMVVETDIGPRLLDGESVIDSVYDPVLNQAYFLTGTRIYVYAVDHKVWTTWELGSKRGISLWRSRSYGAGFLMNLSLVSNASQVVRVNPLTASPNRLEAAHSNQATDFFGDEFSASVFTSYDQEVTTGWLPLSDLVGYGALRTINILGKYFQNTGGASSDVVVKIAYDYDTTVVDTFTFTSAELIAMARGERLRLKVRPSRRKCEAIQVTISEDGVTSPGISVASLGLEVGLKQGAGKALDIRGRK